MEAGDRQWEVEEQTLLRAVDAVRGALQPEPFPYLFMGGIALLEGHDHGGHSHDAAHQGDDHSHHKH